MKDINKKSLAIQKNLLSTDREMVIKGIKEVAKNGSPSVVYHLLLATSKVVFLRHWKRGKRF